MNRGCFSLPIGLILIITPLCFILYNESILKYVLQKILIFTPGSISYNLWKKAPMVITCTAYIFNITNTHEYLNDNFKPNIVEMGPYIFNEFQENVNVTWNPNNTLTFGHIKRWHFDAEISNGSLDDEFVTANIGLVTASYVTRFWSTLELVPISATMSFLEKDIWGVGTVREILFDGLRSSIIDIGNMFSSFISVNIPIDKVGLFYKRNNSKSIYGVLNMETGANDISTMGVIRNWNYRNQTEFNTGKCGSVRGSAVGVLPPGLTREDSIDIFFMDVCRYISFEYYEETILDGIPGYKFIVKKSDFDNGTEIPENVCNCDGDCLPNGVMNASICREGPPVFVSMPHFLNADPVYRNNISSFNPDPNKHLMYIIMEPRTGIILEIAIRLQVNVLIQPNSKISLFRDVQTRMLPLFWGEEKASTTSEVRQYVRLYLMLPMITNCICVVVITIGIAFLISGIRGVLLLRYKTKKSLLTSKFWKVQFNVIKNQDDMDTVNQENNT